MTANNIGLPLLLVLVSTSLMADESATGGTPTVQEIVEKTRCAAYYQGNNRVAKIDMNIVDSQGRTRDRQLTIVRDNMAPTTNQACADQKYYVHFTRPSDLKKTTFIVWKNLGSDDDRWMYLPDLDLVKRIAASDKRTSFVGSHFFYEDISGRNTAEDSYEIIGSDDTHYILKATPKDPDSVEFSHFIAKVRRTDYIPETVEYFDRSGEKYRVCDALEIADVQGHPSVVTSRVKDLRSGGQTTVKYSKMEYDISLSQDIFSERYMRKPAREYLR